MIEKNKELTAYKFKRIDNMCNSWLNHGESGKTQVVRLVRRNSGKWIRRVHPYFRTKGEVIMLTNPLLHYPHQNLKKFIESVNRWSSWHAIANREEGKRSDLIKIIFFPPGHFTKNYIFRLGFLDGLAGFVYAVVMSFHSFLAFKIMDAAKRILNFNYLLLILYLILFPFGQLLRMEINILGRNIAAYPSDLIVFFIAINVLLNKFKYPQIFKYMFSYLFFASFSLLISVNFFTNSEILIGTFYLVRFASYILFFVFVWNIIKSKYQKLRIFNILLVISSIVSVLGLLQYLVLPDVRFLQSFGWDDHLKRIIGSFFDPGYTAIIITFGIILSLISFLEKRSKGSIIFIILNTTSLAFTYSRSGYIALSTGLMKILPCCIPSSLE